MQKKRVPLLVQLKRIRKTLWFSWRYRSHSEALDPFLASLKEWGLSEANIAAVRRVLIAWKQSNQDKMAWFRADHYLEAAMGAVDLVLIPVIIPLGVTDTALFIATFSLAISLVLVSSSLFVSFVKRDHKIKVYGPIHSNVNVFSILFGAAALIATFWHDSTIVGLFLLILSAIAFILCTLYMALVQMTTVNQQVQTAVDQTSQETTEAGMESNPNLL